MAQESAETLDFGTAVVAAVSKTWMSLAVSCPEGTLEISPPEAG